ncbi:MAG: hypothetical protein ACYCXA_09955 [Actinomycetes bacterium]
MRPRVTVYGPASTTAELTRLLGSTFTLQQAGEPWSSGPPVEDPLPAPGSDLGMVVLVDADPATTRWVRERHRGVPLLAVVAPEADAARVATVFDAGARTARHAPRLTSAALIVGAAITLAACSTSSGSASTSTAAASASTSTSAKGASFEAYRSCLAKHGITLPTARPRPSASASTGGPTGVSPSGHPSFGGLPPGVNQSTFDAAQKACGSLRPAGGFGGTGAAGLTALQAFRSCLADNGETVPAGTRLATLMQESTVGSKLAAAITTCRPLLPSTPARTHPTGTATPGS